MMLRSLSLVSLFCLAAPLAAQSFDGLGDLPGGLVLSQPAAVNADGSVVVGTSYAEGGTTSSGERHPFRWENGEMVALDFFPGAFTTFGAATGISADGSVISGVSSDMQQSGQVFVRWVDSVLERLTVSIATDGGGASDVSDDGGTIVGGALRYPSGGGEDREAFLWTESGSQGLGYLPGDRYSGASGVSADGSVVIGASSEFINEAFRPFRWEGSMQALPLPAGSFGGSANDITGDGSVIVGSASDINGDVNARVATRWVGTTVEVIPVPPGGGRYYATGVSDDGAIVVGGSFASLTNASVAWIWTEEAGTRSVASVLADLGISLGGWELTEATAISSDGRVVVGNGRNPAGELEGWRAVLAPGATIVVNASGDEANHPDSQAAELCDVDRDQGGEQCTLRAAIELANARDGRDVIGFDLDGSGTQVLAPEAPLPTLTDAVLIDGSTQPGTVDVPLIRLDGALAGATTDGLRLEGDDVAVRGLLVTSFGRHGIHVASGEGGVLEGLIIGSDAAGTDGLGNGGDGIHVSGGSGLRIGRDDASERAPEALTPQARALINFGVLSLGNLLNGLYVRDEQNASVIRAQRRGEALRSEARFINISVNGFTAGLGNILGGAPIARPNGLNGVCLRGARGVTLKNLIVSDAMKHALEIDASQDIGLLGGLFGMRKATPGVIGDLGEIRESVIRLTQSIGVTLGSDDADDAPVEGGASGGWFMDVEDSQEVSVRNVLAGIAQNIEAIPEDVRMGLRNPFGGLRVFNSPDVQVGLEGLATVFANNGGDATQPQAGVFASGAGTQGFRMVNTHLGTTPTGLMGLGNLGSGLHLEDGLAGALLGGDNPNQTVVSGGNANYGFLFQDLSPEAANLDASAQRINILGGTNLASGLLKAAGGNVIGIPNGLSGFCLNRVTDALLKAFSSGPNGMHGVEVIDSERVELESGSVGTYWQELVDAEEDVMGPEEDGISIVGGVDISVGRRLESDLITNGYLVYVVGAGGRAMFSFQNTRLQLANWAAGVSLEGSAESDAIFDALGNSLEAAVIEESEDVLVENVAILGNGSGSGSGVGGILSKVSTNLTIRLGQFGERIEGGEIRRANAGSALGFLDSGEIRLSLSRLLGGGTGVEATNSSWFAEDNTFEGQEGGSGLGDAIRQIGGLLQGTRNTFTGIEGAAIHADDTAEGVFRFNNVFDTIEGIVVDGNRPASGGGASGGGASGGGVSGGGVSGGGASGARGAAFVATENWWGDASGPSGAGPGSGDPVSAGVDFSDWLTAPFGGVIVRPEAYVYEAGVGQEIGVRMTYASPFGGDDEFRVTLSDERGWISSSPFFTVRQFGGVPAQRFFYVIPDIAGANEVTIRAEARNDPTRTGTATVRIVPSGTTLPLAASVPAGETTIPADGEGRLLVGGEIILNPGGATEETGIVTGFGSILLQEPTRFAHAAGELVIPKGALAVDAEAPPLAPEALAIRAFPNPTPASMTVEVATPEAAASARVSVHDALGREVEVLHDGPLAAGVHPFALAGSRLAPGAYVVRAVTPEATVSTRATVVR